MSTSNVIIREVSPSGRVRTHALDFTPAFCKELVQDDMAHGLVVQADIIVDGVVYFSAGAAPAIL